jgi:hypothetical protein
MTSGALPVAVIVEKGGRSKEGPDSSKELNGIAKMHGLLPQLASAPHQFPGREDEEKTLRQSLAYRANKEKAEGDDYLL